MIRDTWMIWIGWIFVLGGSLFAYIRLSSDIDRLQKRSDNYIIKVAKQDGILEVDCWCGNYLFCEDGAEEFMYTCRKCGTLYTNTDCKTDAEFYTFMGVGWLNE